jgi:hypothetical protein
LASIEHRLEARRKAGFPEPEWEARARHARAEADSGRWVDAEGTMREIDGHLRATEPERELQEFPRGLVGYVPVGERGAPVEEEEDPVANRLALASRLLTVKQSEGWDVSDALESLQEAQAAYRAGDKRNAQRLCEAAVHRLERVGDRR